MAIYRIRLLTRDGRVLTKHDVKAIRNYEAVEIATRLRDSSTGNCAGYEVWRGDRMIVKQFDRGPAA